MMTDMQKETQAPSQDDSKQLKKLLESHLTVLEHKIGRPPTMEELTIFLKGAEAAEGVAAEDRADEAALDDEVDAASAPGEREPKVLGCKVYTGMKMEDGAQVADPKMVLFYETTDGRVYDTTAHEWCQSRPPILDHLQSRPMMFDEQGHDIMSALIHGILDDEDYDDLDKAQMLNEHHRKVWDLNKQLRAQMDELEKSVELEESEVIELPLDAAPAEEQYSQEGEAYAPEDDYVPGDNVLEQIIQGAMERVLVMNEQYVRDLVAHEFSRHMSQLIAILEQDSQDAPYQEFPEAGLE